MSPLGPTGTTPGMQPRAPNTSEEHRVVPTGNRLSRALVGLSVVLVVASGAQPLSGVCTTDTSGAKAKGTPAALWGGLQPTDVGKVPDARDTTEYYGGAQTHDSRHPLFSSIDVEAGYAFTSFMFGFQVWDARGGNAVDPKLIATRDQAPKCERSTAQFLERVGGQEERRIMFDIDAPSGNADFVAVSGKQPFGLSIWHTTNNTAPTILYQDVGPSAYQVFAATLGGRHYAFAAASGTTAQRGLLVYDMSAAKERYGSSTGCKEDTSAATTCGVFRQRLSTDGFTYVDGFTTAGGRTILAATGGPGENFPQGARGLKLWDVTNPTAPVDLTAAGRLFASEPLTGVAAWEQEGRQFVAVQPYGGGARIHEISACLSNGCANLPQVWSQTWPTSIRNDVRWVTYSSDGGDGYLYFGTQALCIDAVQGEWIYDLSNLTSSGPEELTPQQTQPDPADPSRLIGYWSHYYPSR